MNTPEIGSAMSHKFISVDNIHKYYGSSVAPNSPRETAKAKTIPTTMPLHMMGKSILSRMRVLDAPSIWAASLSDGDMLRRMGKILRRTKGYAMTTWAITMITGDPVRFNTPLLYAMRKPNPMVTADIPRGIMSMESRKAFPQCLDLPNSRADNMPTGTARATVQTPKSTEFAIAWMGDTKKKESC